MKIAHFALATAALSAVATGSVPSFKDILLIEAYDVPPGCEFGKKSKKGDYLSIQYTGEIDMESPTGEPGMEFDKSGDLPFHFQLGAGTVIQGWDEGLLDMCVGEKRRLIVGPDKAYGSEINTNHDSPAVDPGAVLLFDVTLMAINDGPRESVGSDLFSFIDRDQNGFLDRREVIEFLAHEEGSYSKEVFYRRYRRFQQEDRDEDGKISWEEFKGPKGESPTK